MLRHLHASDIALIGTVVWFTRSPFPVHSPLVRMLSEPRRSSRTLQTSQSSVFHYVCGLVSSVSPSFDIFRVFNDEQHWSTLTNSTSSSLSTWSTDSPVHSFHGPHLFFQLWISRAWRRIDIADSCQDSTLWLPVASPGVSAMKWEFPNF